MIKTALKKSLFKNKRHATFTISALVIGLIFILGMIGVMTSQLIPQADDPGSGGSARKLLTLPFGITVYKPGSGAQQQVNTRNQKNITVAPVPAADLPLQGVNTTELQYKVTVKVTVTDSTNHVVSDTVESDTDVDDGQALRVAIRNASFVAAVDTPTTLTYPVKLTAWAVGFTRVEKTITTAAEFQTQLDEGVTLTRALGCDLNEDNTIDAGDLAILSNNFGQATTDVLKGDCNLNGAVGSDDLGILSGNFGESGQ